MKKQAQTSAAQQQAAQSHAPERPAEKLDRLLWAAIDYAATHPVDARDVDPRTWHHLLTYSTYDQATAAGEPAAQQPAAREVATRQVPLTDEQVFNLVNNLYSPDTAPADWCEQAAHAAIAEFCRVNGYPLPKENT